MLRLQGDAWSMAKLLTQAITPPPISLYLSLWHDLKPATDGVRLGTSLSNVSCIPPPENSDSSFAETATAGEASEKPTDDICIIDVFRRDPYK